MFHIPALIIADGVKPQTFDTLSTQPDVLATALDMIGVNLTYPILGHSLYSDMKKEVALMMFNEMFALRVRNEIAVIQPNKNALTFHYENKRLVPVPHNIELEKDALAFVTVMDDMYNKQLFKVK
jgi:hypothetical protein